MFKVAIKSIFAVIIVFTGINLAVSTTAIDEVRKKTEFTAADLETVDLFINDTFREMLESPTITDSVKRREDIIVRIARNGQEQYNQQFINSVERNIASALLKVNTWTDEKFITATKLNLAVIAGSLDAPTLLDDALQMKNTNEIGVLYWAFRAISGNNVVSFIKSNPNAELSQEAIEWAMELASKNTPIILEMVAKFAADVDMAQTNDILAIIAQTRIEAYQNNLATQESADGAILAIIASRMSGAEARQMLAQPFATLTSNVLKKYLSGLSPDSPIGDTSSGQLLTSIANLEKNILPTLDISTNFIRAIERKNAADFQTEYDKLLGQLGEKLGANINA